MNTKINKNMNKDALTKRRIAPTLKMMKVGDVERFPAVQWSALLTARQRINIQESKNFSIRRSERNQLEVIRTV